MLHMDHSLFLSIYFLFFDIFSIKNNLLYDPEIKIKSKEYKIKNHK